MSVSRVARAVESVLGANQDVFVLDYSNAEMFQSAWSTGLQKIRPKLGGQGLYWNDQKLTVLVVGEDAPESGLSGMPAALEGINFRGHFSALSWVAAWRLAFPKAKARIVLVSAVGGRGRGHVASTLASLMTARGADGAALVPGVELAEGLEALLGSFRERPTPTFPSGSVRGLLRSVLWDALTSDRERHHAVSNVLGALLLSREVSERPLGSAWQDPLLALVRACGVKPDAGEPGVVAWIDQAARQGLGAVALLDDMAGLWEGFVRGAVGIDEGGGGGPRSKSARFITCGRDRFVATLKELPARLVQHIATEAHRLPLKVLFPDTAVVGADDYTLFLDLRLLPTGSIDTAFYRDLASAGLALFDDNGESKRHLCWLDVTGQEALRTELRGYAADGGADGAAGAPQHPPETLLARLLSLLDPTLPIILFSSTHRAELTEPFRDYGNIISNFRKPILSGLTSDWSRLVEDLRADLRSAVERAVQVRGVREVFRGFERRANPRPGSIGADGCGHLVEVFFDESETEGRQKSICAGGIVVVRRLTAEGKPTPSDDEVLRKLANSDCTWGWCSDTPPSWSNPEHEGRLYKLKGSGLLKGRRGLRELQLMLSAVREAIGEESYFLPFALISDANTALPDWLELPLGVDPSEAVRIFDSTLRTLLRCGIEAVLFHAHKLRSIIECSQTRLAVDLASRGFELQAEPRALFDSFGVWTEGRPKDEPPRWWVRYSLQSEDGLSVLRETLSATMAQPLESSIVRARAVTLDDFKGSRGRGRREPKQLHYLADAIAYVALHCPKQMREEEVREFFDSGWISDWRTNPQVESHFEVARAWSQGDRTRAIRVAASLSKGEPANGFGVDLFADLVDRSARLSGAELRELFSWPPGSWL